MIWCAWSLRSAPARFLRHMPSTAWASAAVGDPLHRAAEHLGRLLRTLFLCDYLAIPDCRREIHTPLNRGESVQQLQRAIPAGQVAPERGRWRQEMAAISGAPVKARPRSGQ